MQVQILWVVSQPQPTWEKRLPTNVAAIINAARRLNPPTDNSRIMGGIQTAGEMILSLISNIVSKVGEGSALGEWRACGSSVQCVRLCASLLAKLLRHVCVCMYGRGSIQALDALAHWCSGKPIYNDAGLACRVCCPMPQLTLTNNLFYISNC
jgi:hypothetical protein